MKFFHRYNSTIHGNYRRAYLRCGLITGFIMAAYVLVRLLMGKPMSSPASYIIDIILLVAVFLFTAFYRNSLPDKKVTLKELMLFGLGTAVLAGLVYGLLLWAIGLTSAEQTVLFTNTMTGQTITAADHQLHYWAAWWAIVAGVETAVLGGFGAFIAAVLFRTEKSEIKNKSTNGHNDNSTPAQ